MKKALQLLVLFVVGCHAQLTTEHPASSAIVQGDSDEVFYKLGPTITQTEYVNTLARVREFIWIHWTVKQIGRLNLEYYTKEGEKALSVFEINVTQDGRVLMHVTVEREFVNRNPKSSSFRQRIKNSREYSVAM